MRGSISDQAMLFSYLSPEARVPAMPETILEFAKRRGNALPVMRVSSENGEVLDEIEFKIETKAEAGVMVLCSLGAAA